MDLVKLAAYLDHELPAYAIPVFIRIQPEIDVTGTFKMVKGDLRDQGYDIDTFDDPVYLMPPGSDAYQPLDADMLASIRAGNAGF